MAKKLDLLKAELERIEKEHGGMLRPEDVVDAAKDEDSVLHAYFQWDQDEAAYQYQLWQARQLISRVTVELVEGQKTQKYYNVQVVVQKEKVNGYFNVETIMSDEAMYNQVLQRALGELEYWKLKYEKIEELHGIINTAKLKKLKK